MTTKVAMSGITQTFGTVVALDSVDFSVRPQTIHALVGENGAGKTTLMKVLYGALHPQRGEVSLDGQSVKFANPKAAIAAGIGMVSQHYSIIPELTALENLLLGAEPGYTINASQAKDRAQELANRMQFNFDWHAPAEGIGPAQAQKLEILKLLWRQAKVMILDEPTAMLSPADSDQLYSKLHELNEQGATVIVVTHRLAEVLNHCDDVTVLRGGKLIASKPVAETNAAELTEMIVGHMVSAVTPAPVEPGPNVLKVDGLSVRGSRGNLAVENASFTLRQGEVVGLAGVDGNGQRELFQALIGVAKPLSGSIALAGSDVTLASVTDRVELGMRLIAEDRHEESVIEDWSIADNAVLGLQRHPRVKTGASVNASVKAQLATNVTTLFPTKFDNVRQKFRDLSGGNQQKIVNARACQLDPKCILAFQPTRGIDINAAALAYQELGRLARSGASVLVVSFDIDELLEHCDRVLVINHGRVSEPAPEDSHDRQAIGALMVGAT